MQTLCSTSLPSKSRDEGFTVAEFVAASAILLIVLVGILGAVQFAGASTRMASSRQAAINMATHQVELARNLPWTSVGLDYGSGVKGSPPGSVPAVQVVTAAQGTFTIKNSIRYDSGANGVHQTKKMTTTVSWTDPSPGGSVSVETKIFGVGGAANTGDVQVTCVDADNPSIKLTGIGVTLNAPSGPDLFVPSETDGKCYFGEVPISPPVATISASNPDYLCDTSQFQAITVATGFQDLGFIPCQKASTAVIRVVGGNGQALQGATLTLVDTDPAHPRTSTGVTAADGTCTFGQLWKSPSAKPYTISATYLGLTASDTFLVTAGGQTVNKTLTIVAPSVISVFAKDGVTGNLITGKNATIAVTDQSTGMQLAGSPSTVTTGSAIFAITHSGNYNVSVTGVAGFVDSPTNVVAATFGTGSNDVNIVLNPTTLLKITVRNTSGPTGLSGIPVTVAGPSGNVLSDAGVSPGVTASSGLATFLILTSGNHTVSALVNGVTYYTSPSSLSLLTGQSTPYAYNIDITPGTLKLTTSGYNSGTRLLEIRDQNKNVVYSQQVSPGAQTITGLLPGAYTISVFSKNKTTPAYPAAPGTNRTDYFTTTAGVPAGGTYTQPGNCASYN